LRSKNKAIATLGRQAEGLRSKNKAIATLGRQAEGLRSKNKAIATLGRQAEGDKCNEGGLRPLAFISGYAFLPAFGLRSKRSEAFLLILLFFATLALLRMAVNAIRRLACLATLGMQAKQKS
jgi:hypothetical protein